MLTVQARTTADAWPEMLPEKFQRLAGAWTTAVAHLSAAYAARLASTGAPG